MDSENSIGLKYNIIETNPKEKKELEEKIRTLDSFYILNVRAIDEINVKNFDGANYKMVVLEIPLDNILTDFNIHNLYKSDIGFEVKDIYARKGNLIIDFTLKGNYYRVKSISK